VNGPSAGEPMRLFVAVDLPDEARQAIGVHQKLIADTLSKSREGLKLVEPARMHLTLVFLGEVQEARVPAVVESMNAPVSVAPFDMAFGGVGVFPPRGRARVLWIGLTEGADLLARLQHDIAERIRVVGIAFDDRPFHPHLTLGRWRDADRRRTSATRRGTPERLRREATALDRSGIARVRVTRATLYQSRLSSSGPAYTALAHATLTA
jgi:RNA 2',3'-cyclic 3'-phosphodiesterase